MWKRIKEVPHFYDQLRVMTGAKELFDELYDKYGDKCEILSGVPKKERGRDSYISIEILISSSGF